MEFKTGPVKSGIVKVKVGDIYKEDCPIDQKQRKELAAYEVDTAVKLIDASKNEAVDMMVADTSIEDIQFVTPFGVHTYGTMTVRAQKARKTRSIARDGKPAETKIAPAMSIKVKHGIISSGKLKEHSEEFGKKLNK